MRPGLDRLDDRCLPSAVPTGLSPSQLQAAYGLNNLTFAVGGASVPASGKGETIAIIDVEHDPYIYSDLTKFDATFGLSTPAQLGQNAPGTPWFNVINLAGNSTDDGWAEEESLDVESAHAVAPGANILVIEAASDNLSDLLNAILVARYTSGVAVVSMSWGESEFPNEAAFDTYFTTPAGHVGMTFVASAGDTPGAEWPAVSPDVVSVGGTTLNVGSGGVYLGESAWTSTGGGYSRYEPEPAYQLSLQSTGLRSVPDVAFDANPNTGMSVYSTAPSTGQGSWAVYGGTSLGAPAWSGITAIIDEGYAILGYVPSMDGATQTLPFLYNRPSTEFHTVAQVASRRLGTTSSVTTTGLGTPDGAAFITSMLGWNLVAFNAATPSARAAITVLATAPAVAIVAPATTAVAPSATPALATIPTVALGPGQGGGTPTPAPVDLGHPARPALGTGTIVAAPMAVAPPDLVQAAPASAVAASADVMAFLAIPTASPADPVPAGVATASASPARTSPAGATAAAIVALRPIVAPGPVVILPLADRPAGRRRGPPRVGG